MRGLHGLRSDVYVCLLVCFCILEWVGVKSGLWTDFERDEIVGESDVLENNY